MWLKKKSPLSFFTLFPILIYLFYQLFISVFTPSVAAPLFYYYSFTLLFLPLLLLFHHHLFSIFNLFYQLYISFPSLTYGFSVLQLLLPFYYSISAIDITLFTIYSPPYLTIIFPSSQTRRTTRRKPHPRIRTCRRCGPRSPSRRHTATTAWTIAVTPSTPLSPTPLHPSPPE